MKNLVLLSGLSLFLFSCGESDEVKSVKMNAENYAKKFCECEKASNDIKAQCLDELKQESLILEINFKNAEEAGANMEELKGETKKIIEDIMSSCK